MIDSPDLWKLYWCQRRERLDVTNGKMEAVLAVSRIVSSMNGDPVRVVELGCGEGHLVAALGREHELMLVGVDCEPSAIQRARSCYPNVEFHVADYVDSALTDRIGRAHFVLLVNTLHEVYSAECEPETGRIDPRKGQKQVRAALASAARVVRQGGYLVLFDGVEHRCPGEQLIRIKFRSSEARREFQRFADDYRPLQIQYRTLGDERIELSVRDFTRYITKTIFLNSPLWDLERWESYQYYREAEFRAALAALGFTIRDLQLFSPSRSEWESRVAIETEAIDFPEEHILIVAQR